MPIALTNKQNKFLIMKESQFTYGGSLNSYGEKYNFKGKKFSIKYELFTIWNLSKLLIKRKNARSS